MKPSLTALLILASSLVVCSTAWAGHASAREFNPVCNQEPDLIGGWSKNQVTPEVTDSLARVISQMNTDSTLARITDVRSQVVNGVNYAVEFEMDNGQQWHVMFYRSFNGRTTITEPAHLGQLCPK